MTTPAEQLSELLASGLFNPDAAERTRARAALVAHPMPAVAAFFATDKRSYHTLQDGAKLVKAARAFVALGADGPRFALALIEAWRTRPGRYPHQLESLLMVPMAFGVEAEAFALLADEPEVYLPNPKKVLPAGLSKLKSLEKLRIPEGTITCGDNLAELGALPKPIRLELWVKNVDLALFAPASPGVRDLRLLDRLTKLRSLDLWGTPVDSLGPLVGKALTWLCLNWTTLPDLSPLIRIPTLKMVVMVGARDDTPGLAELVAARPDVGISR